jgi:hypothetical protein
MPFSTATFSSANARFATTPSPLRVLTTTYTGSTEESALDELHQIAFA